MVKPTGKAIREAIDRFDHLQARAEEAEAIMRKAQAQAQAAVPLVGQ